MIGKELIKRGWDGQVKPVILNSGDASSDSEKLFESYPIENTGTHIFIELTEAREKKLKEIELELRQELSLACNERLNNCGLSICLNNSDNGILQYTPIIKESIIDRKKHKTEIDIYMKGTDKIYLVPGEEFNFAIKSISEKKKFLYKTF